VGACCHFGSDPGLLHPKLTTPKPIIPVPEGLHHERCLLSKPHYCLPVANHANDSKLLDPSLEAGKSRM
jgi:hypothetical protein